MFFSIKQYINLFNSLIINNFSETLGSNAYDAVKNANETGNGITKIEFNKLQSLYKPKDLAEAMDSFSRASKMRVEKSSLYDIKEFISKHKNAVEAVTEETVNKKAVLKEETKETIQTKETIDSSIFKNTLKKGMHGKDVKALQDFLKENGYLNIDKTTEYFGSMTENALKEYQKTLPNQKPEWIDGVLSINGKTLRHIKEKLNTRKPNTDIPPAEVVDLHKPIIEKKDKNKSTLLDPDKKYIEIKESKTEYKNEGLEDIDKYNFKDFLNKLSIDLNKGDMYLEYIVKEKLTVGDKVTNISGRTIYEDSFGNKYYKNSKEVILNKNNFKENIGDRDLVKALLKKYNYEDERNFFTKLFSGNNSEKDFLVTRSENIDKIDTKNAKSVKEFLFDMDFNGKIDTNLSFYVSEGSINDNFKTIPQIQNLLENIGMSTNLDVLKTDISFREKFISKLNLILALNVPFTVLSEKGGYEAFIKEELNIENKFRDKLEKELNSDTVKEEIKSKLKKEGIDDSEENIYAIKEYTLGVALGYIKGFGLNINISELTEGILDGITVGGFSKDGKLGFNIGVNKSLLKERFDRTSVDVDALASVSGIGVHFGVGQELANEVSGDSVKVGLGVGLGVGLDGKAYSLLDASISDLSTSDMEGFNRIMKIESKSIDSFIQLIKENKELTDDKIRDLYKGNLSDEDLNKIKDNFKDLKEKYKTSIGSLKLDNKTTQILDIRFKKAVLSSMATNLFTQAEGFKLTGVGAFIIPGVMAGVYPLIEYNWSEHYSEQNDVKDSISNKITSMNIEDFIEQNDIKEYIDIVGDSIYIDTSKVNFDFINDEGMDFAGVDGSDTNIQIKAKEGYRINANLVEQYVYDDKENKSYKRFDLAITAISSDSEGGISGSMIGLSKEFLQNIDNLGSGFDSQTRYKKGAIDVINPKNTIDKKWKGVLDLNKSIKNKDLTNLIDNAKDEKTKSFILAKVSQLISKSNDFNEGDLTKWDTDKYIKIDEGRSNSFDKLVKKGLGGDIKEERKAYYEALKKEGKIGKTTINGIGFDMKSTLLWDNSGKAHAIKGAEAQAGNISVLSKDGKEVFIKIENADFVKSFVNKLTPIQLKLAGIENTKEGREQLVNSINSGEKELGYAKDPYGFDDMIILKTNVQSSIGTASKSANYINTKFKSLGFVAGWSERDDNNIGSGNNADSGNNFTEGSRIGTTGHTLNTGLVTDGVDL